LELPSVILPAALRVSYAGKAVLKGYYSQISKRVVFRLWGAKSGEYTTFEYFDADPSMPYAVNFWYRRQLPGTDSDSDDNCAMIRERHELLVNTSTMEISAVSMQSTAHKITGGTPQEEEIPWSKVWEGQKVQPKQNETFSGLKKLPVAVIDNADKYGDGEGYTDYTPTLISIQKNINKLVAIRQLVIDLSEQPQLIIPQEYINEDGSVDWNRVRLRVKLDGEDASEIRIVGWTGNLENSDKQWVFYRDEFRALTGLAPILFGIVDGEARSGIAKRLGLVATEAEITARRHYWEKGFKQIIEVASALQNQFGQGNQFGTIEEILPQMTIRWADAIPAEYGEFSAMITQQFQAGLRTIDSAVELLNRDDSISEEWLDKEISALKEKEKQMTEGFDPFNKGMNPNVKNPDGSNPRKEVADGTGIRNDNK
jgi:hypothetical protein